MLHSNNLASRLISRIFLWQLLVTVVALMPNSSQAQYRLSEDCPPAFSIVDTGAWGRDASGNPTRLAGGTLVDIGQQDKAQPDADNAWVTCYPLSHRSERASDKNGMPIPLVAHVVFPTLLGFTQNENTQQTIETLNQLFQSRVPGAPVSEVNFGNGLGTGMCKFGRFYDRGRFLNDYACLISMERGSETDLLVYCQASPHNCGYAASLGEGVMAYQQPWDYPFTRVANTLDEAVQAWIEFVVSGQAYIEERRVVRD